MKTIDDRIKAYAEIVNKSFSPDKVDVRHIVELAVESGIKFAQKWISVEEELPEYGCEVIIKFVNGTHSTAYYLRHKNKVDAFYYYPKADFEFRLEAVTHWRQIELK